MHPDLVIGLANQRMAELRDRSQRAVPRSARPGLRQRLGRRLVRWGHRLAPATPATSAPAPTSYAGASTCGRRPATMGP